MVSYALGLGFLMCWLWVFYFNGPLLYIVSAKWSEDAEMIFLLFLISHSFSFLLTATKLTRSAPMTKRRTVVATGALFMTLGTALTGFVPGEPDFNFHQPLSMAAAVLAGLGSAPLFASWGEAFGSLPVKQAAISYAGAVTVSTVIFFQCNISSVNLSVMIAAILPLASLAILYTQYIPIARKNLQNAPVIEKEIVCPLPPKLMIVLILFYSTSGLMHKIIYSVKTLPIQETYWLTNIVYCVACIIAGASIYFHPKIDLRLLYRPALPLLGAGFMLLPFLADFYELLPFTLLQSGFALFDIYAWLLLIYLGARYHSAGYILSWGMFFMTIASFIGELTSTYILSFVALTMRHVDILSLLAAFIMLLATMVFQDERETFAGWQAEPSQDSPFQAHSEASVTLLPAGAALVHTAHSANLSAAAAPPVLPPLLHTDIADHPNIQQADVFYQHYNLTARESEVTSLLLKGRNNPYIRESLNISDNTLKSHLRNIYRKLSVTNRQELFSLFDQFSHSA